MTMSPTYRFAPARVPLRRLDRRVRICRTGNERTSVGPCLSLNLRFMRAMAGSLTKQTVTLSSGKPSSRCTRSENLDKDFKANGTRRWRFRIIPGGSRLSVCVGIRGIGFFTGPVGARYRTRGRTHELVVCLDDLLHQIMPYHIAFIEMDEGDPFYLADDVDRFDQS